MIKNNNQHSQFDLFEVCHGFKININTTWFLFTVCVATFVLYAVIQVI